MNYFRGQIEHAVIFRAYLVAIELMVDAKCFHSVLDVSTLHLIADIFANE